ncbi:MAG: isoprenylcysteine carboxylmethyltransferase family protein [Anaerolineae bacterium]|nr:isoprenylcysteine carboxylmethyltransferase family protein [Anaerolineae bacterium]
MAVVTNPFFWAFVSMAGLVGCCGVVSSRRLGRLTLYGAVMVALFDLGRCVLVLPGVEQTRFHVPAGLGVLGTVLLIGGGVAALAPCGLIRPLNVADEHTALTTGGLYTVVRNPIYLGELIWCLGWAILNGSVAGVVLVPVWWAGLLVLITLEEESLERSIGEPYRVYKAQVRGRIIPGLPI